MAVARPTLSVADAADGTGGTATIADSTSTALNEVFTQAVDGELGTAAWTLEGSRTGDGTVTITADKGYYWVYCRSTQETESGSDSGGTDEVEVSNFVYQVFTSGSDAVMDQCLVAVQAGIQGLTLDGVDNSNVVIHKVPDDEAVIDDQVKQAILIAPGGAETMNPLDGVNCQDDVGYPVFVGMVAADNQDQTKDRGKFLLWREKVARAFRNQRLTGVAEVYTCQIETRDIVAPAFFAKNKFVSTMIVRCISRENRGN